MIAIAVALLVQGSWDRKLSDGTTLTLAAVSDDFQQISWLPSGGKLSKWLAPLFQRSGGVLSNPDHILTVDLVIDNRKGSVFPNVKMYEGARKLAQSSSVGYLDDMTAPRSPYLATATRPFPDGKESFNLRVACANGKWNIVGAYDMVSKKASGMLFSPEITFEDRKKPEWHGIRVAIKLDKSLLDGNTDYRIVAFAENGKELPSGGSMAPAHSVGPTEFYFTRYNHKVVRLEIQTRKFEWFDFSDVRLIPNK